MTDHTGASRHGDLAAVQDRSWCCEGHHAEGCTDDPPFTVCCWRCPINPSESHTAFLTAIEKARCIRQERAHDGGLYRLLAVDCPEWHDSGIHRITYPARDSGRRGLRRRLRRHLIETHGYLDAVADVEAERLVPKGGQPNA